MIHSPVPGKPNRVLKWVLTLTSVAASSSLVWGAEVVDRLRAEGLQPIEPPRPAADFELPRLGGGTLRLSDLSGSWSLVTFWASWCGPCRTEMPSLESLHQRYADDGLEVVGISVDRSQAAAKAFLDQHRLTFPQLWDGPGRVGADYGAVAIPLSVLIDPAGRVVASAQGARDWRRMSGLIETLLEIEPVQSAEASGFGETADHTSPVDPPTAEILLSQSEVGVGQTFELEVRLRWQGQLGEYLLQPPRVLLPDGIVQKGVTAATSSREGARQVTYRIQLVAERAGDFALDPVELQYLSRWSNEPVTEQLQGPSVTVKARTIAGFEPRRLAWLVGAATAVLVVSLTLLRQRKVRAVAAVNEPSVDWNHCMSRLRRARQLRLEGDRAGSALELLRLLEDAAPESTTAADLSPEMLESLRFGGRVPTPAELDRLERNVTRVVEARRPNNDDTARRALELQQDEETS